MKCLVLQNSQPGSFYPLLYVLGASDKKTRLVFLTNSELGSLTMTGYIWEE